MKKIILLLVFLGLAVSYGYSQTYYYQAVADIDEDGVKSIAKGGFYITFIKEKSICYESDENGYKKHTFEVNYKYIKKTKEGTLVYTSNSKYSAGFNFGTFYFSSDFSKLISETPYGIYRRKEYKRTKAPKADDNIPKF
jgi:hypothetical protein